MSTKKSKSKKMLLTVTGPDKPGITSTLTKVLSRADVALLDIEQVVVQGHLTLCLLVDVEQNTEMGEKIIKDVLFEARKLSQDVEVKEIAVADAMENAAKSRYVLTVLGEPIDAQSLHVLSSLIADRNGNIDSIRRLSRGGLSSIEMNLALPKVDGLLANLKKELISQMAKRNVDIALQRESLSRRNKRLVALDMDSTLIRVEVIDELARIHGVFSEVSEITKRAMAGEFDFTESLKKRVKLLEGMPVEHLHQLADRLPLSEGANELVKVLKGLGYKVGIISGGFAIAADRLKEILNLDFAYANRLKSAEGKLTGEIELPIVDAEKKADLLQWVAHKEGIPLEQTVAIGDGANDALMLAQAGLGIAFHAKPKLKMSADTSVSHGGLEKILYLLGMNARDVGEFLQSH